MLENKKKSSEPVLDFISGKTNTASAKRLTRNIRDIRSLWLLAKMSRDVDE